MEDLTLVAVVVVALFFDFTNGFHDTANAIATSVSTRALTPRTAVLLAAILNFAGAFVSLKVAATIATGIVNPEAVTLSVILAGLVGAITWNLVTWFLGLPSSSSHALIGGVVGRGDRRGRVGRHRVAGRVGQGRQARPALTHARLPHRAHDDARDRLGDSEAVAEPREPRLPPRADRLRELRGLHARNERRPEDDGDHRARAHRVRPSERRGVRHPVLGGRSAPRPQWRSAPTRAAGGSSRPWARASPRSIRRRDSPPRPRAQESSGRRRTSASRSRRRRRSRAASWGQERVGRLAAVRWGIAGNIAIAWILTLPAAGLVGATMEVVTRMPAGNLVVFLLAAAIATAAFLGRRYETRRLVPAHA